MSKQFRSKTHNKRRKSHQTSGRKQKSSINPSQLVQEAQKIEVETFKASKKFQDYNFPDRLKQNLASMGFEYPTEIQEKTFQKLIQRTDLIGIANTGTGKTGAFLIPIIQNLLNQSKRFTSLVIVPTRELALQVEQEFLKLSNGMSIHCSSHIGGTSVRADIQKLKLKKDVIIGTPGRLLDLMNQNQIKAEKIETLILDEFDRMLDMGFVNDIRKITRKMKNREQTLLFSATMDPKQKNIINEIVQSPEIISVSSGQTTSKNVSQDIIRVPNGGNKFDILKNLLSGKDFKKVILFAETKRLADRLSKKLNQAGILSDQIHGNKSQNYRVKALNKFKKGRIKVLVATDVAARGVDVESVSHVINYQLPLTYDTYIHRIGRTGRAGKSGKAYTFID